MLFYGHGVLDFDYEEKAARLAFGLITNHAFAGGNKRIVILAMMVMPGLNDIPIVSTNDDFTELGLGVAEGSLGYEDILVWITSHGQVS